MNPIKPVLKLTIVDPREFDGNPYQVAERAIRQCEALAEVMAEQLAAAEIMARNAELERSLDVPAAAAGWTESPQGRAHAECLRAVLLLQARLVALRKAAAYDPKKAR